MKMLTGGYYYKNRYLLAYGYLEENHVVLWMRTELNANIYFRRVFMLDEFDLLT